MGQAWLGVWLLIFSPHELWPVKILTQVFASKVDLWMKLVSVFSTTGKRSTVKSRPDLPSNTRIMNAVL